MFFRGPWLALECGSVAGIGFHYPGPRGQPMTSDHIKELVSLDRLLDHYGSASQGDKRRCLKQENHTNRDSHFSASIFNDRLTCHSQGCFKNADIFEVVGTMEGLQSFQDQKARIEEMFGLDRSEANQKKRIVRTYDYVDQEGQLLFQTVRYEPKDFRQRRPDGNGEWIWNLKDTRLILFKLREVRAAQNVLVVEGEKDVETAYTLGLPEGWAATCNPMGANKWEPQYSEALQNKKIVICPDRDEPGKRHGERIAQQLQGIAKEICWLDLPSDKDLSEWVHQGGATTTFQDLILHAPVFQVTKNDETGLGFHVTSMSDLLNEPEEETEWLVENLLPTGGLSVIGGKPKAGKSTTVRNLCLAVAHGEPFLGLTTTQGAVLYCAFEEKRGEVKRHFKQLGAEPTDQIESFIGRAPEDFVEQVQGVFGRINPVLINLDTLAKVTRISDMNDYAKVTIALDPYLQLARQSGAHLMLVHHNGKSERDGGDSLLGSTAIFGTVDTCLIQKRSDKYRTIQSINRYGTDLEETVLEWNEETKAISLGGE